MEAEEEEEQAGEWERTEVTVSCLVSSVCRVVWLVKSTLGRQGSRDAAVAVNHCKRMSAHLFMGRENLF